MKKKTVNTLIKRSLSASLALALIFCFGAAYAGAVGKTLETGNDAESIGYAGSSSASEVKADEAGNRGVLVDNGDEMEYIIDQIEEEIVPVALREPTHDDVFFPFFCMVIALIIELCYFKKYKAYQKEIYELRAKLLGGYFSGRK